jgi:PAS domain S-box-containing protein
MTDQPAQPKDQAPRTPADKWPDDSPEQQQANRTLREERFRLLVHGVTDYAIFLLDPEGRIICWNTGAERIFGFSEAEVLGQSYARFFTPEDLQSGEPQKELRTAAEEGSARDDRWHVRKDGSRFWCRGTITAIRQDGHTLLGFAKVVHDLKEEEVKKELRDRAKELLEADRLKDEFLAMLSHELRNPLAPILHAMHVLRQDRSDNPLLTQAKDIVDRQVRQMARLVDDLLDVSRITTGKIELRWEAAEFGTVVERAVEAARPHVDARQHELSLNLHRQSLWLEADAARLEQVVLNLLTNSCKYTEPGGSIQITVGREGNEAVLRVRDNGSGIAPALLPRIFDLFVQADRSLDRSQGGLGIGLTLVRKIVDLHGGSVTAASEGLGKGSEFTLRLPLLGAAQAQAGETADERVQPPVARLRVLVVEDNVDAATSLEMLLRLYGHEVRVENSGPKALEVLAAFRPDVVLLDIGLPGMDGHEVARRLRAQAEWAQLPLVAMSGYSEDEARRQKGYEGVFDRHLVKPADPDSLQTLLAGLGK